MEHRRCIQPPVVCDGRVSVTIARCAEADVADVVRFLDEEWKRGHVLVTSRALLDWQYRNADGSYSFLVARQSGEVVGLVGYIATRRYDASLAGANVLWLTTWTVKREAGAAALGLSLLQRGRTAAAHVAIGALGLNPATCAIYSTLGFRVGELEHYAVDRRGTDAAKSSSISAVDATTRGDFDSLTISSGAAVAPRKTARYFHDRYVAHPFYAYRVVCLRDGETPVGLLATRVAEHDGWRALRIVDFIGEPAVLGRCGGVIQSLLREHDTVYADVYNIGIDASVFERAGFRRIDPDGAEIVPDHFEPFEARNVRLFFAVHGANDVMLFKGDADQDRPNRIGDVTQ